MLIVQAHPIIRTFIKDYAMSNLEPTKSRKPSDYELNDEELEKAVGGGRNSSKGSANNTTKGPSESLSLSFAKIQYCY